AVAAALVIALAAALPGPAAEAIRAAFPGPAGGSARPARLPGARRRVFVRRVAPAVRGTPAPDGRLNPMQLWPFVLFAGVLFFLPFNLLRALESPAPVVCCFLFALVFAYALATVVVRRAIPVAVTVLVFLAVLAGIEPYKFRYDEGIPDMNYAAPLDLRGAVEADYGRQAEFDAALKVYEQARVRRNDAFQRLQRNRDGWKWTLDDVRRLDVTEKVRAYAEALALVSKLKEEEEQLGAEKKGLYELWWRMERENKVIPARYTRDDLDLGFLLRAPDGGPLPDDGKRLLHVYDWPTAAPADRQPVVIVTVSGGGLRSAAWTFTVLRTLEERLAEQGIDFPKRVRIITGASGGMFGAAYYVATLKEKRPFLDAAVAGNIQGLRARNDLLYERLTKDHLTPIIQQTVFEDLPNLFSPWPARNDRGKELERSWTKYLEGALNCSFADLRAGERAGEIPSLVFTPMMVEDGRRLIVSNLDMRNVLTNDGNMLFEAATADPHGAECHSRDALELFRLFPGAADRFRLATAARMSASFPFFSPAVSLPVAPRRRVVDAGYYDNYGVSLAAAWLISRSNRRWLMKNASKAVLLQIRDGVDQPQRKLRRIDQESSTRLTRALEEASSPLEGLYNARVGSSSFRNDGQLELLTQFLRDLEAVARDEDTLRAEQVSRPFQVVNFEFHGRAALSWYLSRPERDEVAAAINKSVPQFDIDYPKRIELLHRWWIDPNGFTIP
ncbi:MAG: patatin-like phospholipase family protein, partial [Planctomycetes bacterium]|nr:patatin-like phospholipase family protein [Planctomycetota bacterium]